MTVEDLHHKIECFDYRGIAYVQQGNKYFSIVTVDSIKTGDADRVKVILVIDDKPLEITEVLDWEMK